MNYQPQLVSWSRISEPSTVSWHVLTSLRTWEMLIPTVNFMNRPGHNSDKAQHTLRYTSTSMLDLLPLIPMPRMFRHFLTVKALYQGWCWYLRRCERKSRWINVKGKTLRGWGSDLLISPLLRFAPPISMGWVFLYIGLWMFPQIRVPPNHPF